MKSKPHYPYSSPTPITPFIIFCYCSKRQGNCTFCGFYCIKYKTYCWKMDCRNLSEEGRISAPSDWKMLDKRGAIYRNRICLQLSLANNTGFISKISPFLLIAHLFKTQRICWLLAAKWTQISTKQTSRNIKRIHCFILLKILCMFWTLRNN